jgi:hypothetical protein
MRTYSVTFYDFGELRNIHARNEDGAIKKAVVKMNEKIIPAIYPDLPRGFLTVTDEDVAAVETE